MCSLLWDLPFLFAYLDDILAVSPTKRVHLLHLRSLFKRLVAHVLIINLAKSQLGLDATDFLALHIIKDATVTLPSKVEAIKCFPWPVADNMLREFLAIVTFCHRFI